MDNGKSTKERKNEEVPKAKLLWIRICASAPLLLSERANSKSFAIPNLFKLDRSEFWARSKMSGLFHSSKETKIPSPPSSKAVSKSTFFNCSESLVVSGEISTFAVLLFIMRSNFPSSPKSEILKFCQELLSMDPTESETLWTGSFEKVAKLCFVKSVSPPWRLNSISFSVFKSKLMLDHRIRDFCWSNCDLLWGDHSKKMNSENKLTNNEIKKVGTPQKKIPCPRERRARISLVDDHFP